MIKRFKGMKIGTKLPLVTTLLVAVAVATMSLVSAQSTRTLMLDGAVEKVRSVATLKADAVESFLDAIQRDLRQLVESPVTMDALKDLTRAYLATENPEQVLKRVFVTENPFAVGEKDQLVKANTGNSYGFYHEDYHPYFKEVKDQFGYYDVFLIDPEGNLIYSVFKENDFATNLKTGPWKNSGLAQAFDQAITLGAEDPSALIDFAPYEPSNFAPAAFLARPVFDSENGKLLGVLAYQMPVDALSQTTNEVSGLGTTANGFLVGEDRLLRSDSLLTEQIDVLSTFYDGASVGAGFAGEAGAQLETGLAGEAVVEGFAPVKVGALNWVVFVHQNQDEVLSGLRSAVIKQIDIAAAIFGAVFLVSVLFSRSIALPVQRLTSAVNDVAGGSLETEVPETERLDEVGDLARATEVFRQNAVEMEELNAQQLTANEQMKQLTQEREAAAENERKLAQEREETDRLAAEAREAMMTKLDGAFGDVVSAALVGEFSKRVDARFDDEVLIALSNNMNQLMEVVDTGLSHTSSALERVAAGDLTQLMEGEFKGAFGVLQGNVNDMIVALTTLIAGISDSGATLTGSSEELRETADVLSRQAEQNAASAEETSSALEELSASVRMVDTNVQSVSSSAKEASVLAAESEDIAAQAAVSMTRIADGSKEISRVVDVINDIAFQINLLALNAGVEAARAGEAGLGFSVVASEVRQLSHRASEASKEIAEVIEQSDQAVVAGVAHVSSAKDSLEKIAHSVVSISSSIADVTTAITEQSSGIREITSSVSQIDANTQKQAAAFEEVTASSHLLASEAVELSNGTRRFKVARHLVDQSEEPGMDQAKTRDPEMPLAASG